MKAKISHINLLCVKIRNIQEMGQKPCHLGTEEETDE
jgi:hypothetical protein